MKKIKYFAIIAASIFTLTSCTDIVEVDDLKAKENKPSTGAPTVDKVVLATDAEFPIEGANFEQVVRIEGTNLGDITSLKFNDIEVDSKEIYSTYDMLLAPIPRALPKEVTNTIYITTKHGELSIPFVVSIPDLQSMDSRMNLPSREIRRLLQVIILTSTVLQLRKQLLI